MGVCNTREGNCRLRGRLSSDGVLAQCHHAGGLWTGGMFGRVVWTPSRASARVRERFAHGDTQAPGSTGMGRNRTAVYIASCERSDPISLKGIPVPVVE